MPLEFLQSLSEMVIVGELTALSLLVGGIIMVVGIIIAKIVKLLFNKYYAPTLEKDTAAEFTTSAIPASGRTASALDSSSASQNLSPATVAPLETKVAVHLQKMGLVWS